MNFRHLSFCIFAAAMLVMPGMGHAQGVYPRIEPACYSCGTIDRAGAKAKARRYVPEIARPALRWSSCRQAFS